MKNHVISFDAYIEILSKEALKKVNDFVEMKYISLSGNVKGNISVLNNDLIEKYLHKKGYVRNMLLGSIVYTKDFVCVEIEENYVKIWHDSNKPRVTFIKESLLTGLPLTLNYFERI